MNGDFICLNKSLAFQDSVHLKEFFKMFESTPPSDYKTKLNFTMVFKSIESV